jgi:hypothetical protein
MSAEVEEHRTAGRQPLRADGNCLGVALEDCWRLARLAAPAADLTQLSTVADAVTALSLIRPPAFLRRRDAGWVERVLQAASARWHGWSIRTCDALGPGNVVLCLRSLRQLYGIGRPEAHWVVLEVTQGEILRHDRLWPQIEISHPQATRACAKAVLEHPGPTLLV